MSEPRRLSDETNDPLERALLDAGAAVGGSARARARTLAALGLAASAVVVPGTAVAAAALSPAAAKAGWLKILGGFLLGGAVAAPTGYLVWQHNQHAGDGGRAGRATVSVVRPTFAPPEPPVPVPLPPPVAAVAPEPAVAAAEAPSPVPALAPAPAAPSARASRVASRAPAPSRAAVAAPPAAVASSPTLTQELVMLDAARARLAAGEAADALSLLDAYARAYPRGRLGLEAEVLRIDALARAGRGAAASRRAEQFLRAHPRSALAPRVRAHLDD